MEFPGSVGERHGYIHCTNQDLVAPIRRKLFDVDFDIIGEIGDIETLAVNTSIRDRARLKRMYGAGRWRKLKGIARVRLRSGRVRLAELHWYEAHGIGRRDMRRKRYLD